MDVEGIIKKMIGKNDFKLSKDVPISYIFYKGTIHILGIFRAFLKKGNLKGTKKDYPLEKKVIF